MTAKITRLPIPGIALILIITTLVFGLSLLNDFVWDDWVLMVPNPVYLEFDLKGIFFGLANSVEYLPVRDLSIALDAALWGMKPFGFHLSNLVYYLLSLFVLHRAMIHLGQLFEAREPERLAFWATLLFAVHPLHAEVVNFIGARNSILAGLFLFLSFNLILRSLQESRAGLTWASLACYLLALFSKAIVVFFPVFLAVFLYLLPRNVASLKTRFSLLAGFVVITAAAVALHLYFASESNIASDQLIRFGVKNTWFQYVKALHIILFYVRMTLVPWPLTVEYPTDLIMPGSIYQTLATVILLLGACTVFWKSRNHLPILALGIAWFFSALVPVLNFFPTHPIVADRYGYLAICGFSVIFGYWVSRPKDWQKVARVFGCIVIVTAAGVSLSRTLDWRNDVSLWKSAVAANPTTGRVQLAQALWEKGQYDAALRELATHKGQAGGFWHSYYAGKLAMINGQPEGAIAYFEAALAQGGSGRGSVYVNLAQALELVGNKQLALENYLKSLQTRDPDKFSHYRNTAKTAIDRIWKDMAPALETTAQKALENPKDFIIQAEAAEFYYSIGKYEEAIKLYLQALSLQPSRWEVWHNLGLTYMKTGDYPKAINAFDTVLTISPENINSLNQLGNSYLETNRQDLAIRSFKRALAIDPRFFFAAFNLGQLYFLRGDRNEAFKYLSFARSLIAVDDPRHERIDIYLRQMDND